MRGPAKTSNCSFTGLGSLGLGKVQIDQKLAPCEHQIKCGPVSEITVVARRECVMNIVVKPVLTAGSGVMRMAWLRATRSKAPKLGAWDYGGGRG